MVFIKPQQWETWLRDELFVTHLLEIMFLFLLCREKELSAQSIIEMEGNKTAITNLKVRNTETSCLMLLLKD